MDVMIASPLESSLVERIRAAEPEYTVLYDPALLPPPRYPSDHRGADAFARTGEQQATWDSWIGRAAILFGIPGDTPQGLRYALDRGPNIRWIQGTAAGAGEQVRAAQLSAAELARVRFTSAAGVHGSMLAEFALFGILALLKNVRRLLDDQAHERWAHYAQGELHGATIVVVGLGHIGAEIARLGRAFNAHVVAVTRDGEPVDVAAETVGTARLAEVAARADVLVCALPNTDQTRGLIGRPVIEALPAQAIVVNVGRGPVIDEEALVEALVTKRIAGAALDVFAREPLPPQSPLWKLDNVILSPHTAALSVHENARIVDLFVDNLRRYRTGEPLRSLVDTALFY